MKRKLAIGIAMLLFVYGGHLAQAQLSGTYTIDQTGGGNYISFQAATVDLMAQGVNGPVTFLVAGDPPNNVYTECIGGTAGLTEITGASSINTITFSEAPGDEIILQADEGNYDFFIFLVGADYIRIDGFELSGVYSSFNISLSGGADHNDIRNIATDSEETNTTCIRIYQSDDNLVEGCLLGGEGSGVICQESDNIIVRGNTIPETSGYGVCIFQSVSCLIDSNDIMHSGICYDGIFSSDCCDLIVQNNMIKGEARAGIYLLDALRANVWFNSIENIFDAGIKIESTFAGNVPDAVLNNAVNGYGSSIDINDPVDIPVQMDNNLWFSSTGRVGYLGGIEYNDLPAWQTVTGQDEHSRNAPPGFISSSDLHILEYSICRSNGVAVPGVPEDVDGETRNDPPDIGADEFQGPAFYGLSGTYTVNQTLPTDFPAGINFTSFADVQSVLEASWINSSVIFEVYDDGGEIMETIGGSTGLGWVCGTSPVNTITFTPAADENPVIHGDARAVNLGQDIRPHDTSDIIFDGLIFSGHEYTGVYVKCADRITIRNCRLENGWYGIDFYNQMGNPCESPQVIDNVIDGGIRTGVKMQGAPDALVTGNSIRIEEHHFYGIEAINSPGISIINNAIVGEFESGLRLEDTPDANVIFNSVFSDYFSGAGLLTDSTGPSTVPAIIANNAFDTWGLSGFPCIIITDPDEIPDLLDYNVYHTEYGTIGSLGSAEYTDLELWQTDSGSDDNSRTGDPLFLSSVDLHIDPASACCGAGLYFSAYPIDLDAQVRSDPPEIGAYELNECASTPTPPSPTPTGTTPTPTPTPTSPPPVPATGIPFLLIAIGLMSLMLTRWNGFQQRD